VRVADKKKHEPYLPPKYEYADAAAVQALLRGEANAIQQKRALDWIIVQAARTYDLHYHPDSSRDTDFALGRAFVGMELVKMTKLDLAVLMEKERPNNETD